LFNICTDHFEDLGIDRRIILKCILKKIGWKCMSWIEGGDRTEVDTTLDI
jgi:hypothetical protein